MVKPVEVGEVVKRLKEDEVYINLIIKKELKESFEKWCERNERTVSSGVRYLIRKEVER